MHPAYGVVHQRVRKFLLANTPRSTPCPICHEPLGQDTPARLLDLHHEDPEAKRRGEPGTALAHRSCNRGHHIGAREPAHLAGERQRRQAKADRALVAETSQGRVW